MVRITISGKPGAGKSSQKDILALKLQYTPYSIGDMKGKLAEKEGVNIDEFMAKYPPSKVHGIVDEYQKELGKKEDNYVIDGWMSWHLTPNPIKIYLNVDWDVAAERIYKDESRGADEPEYTSVKQCKKIIKNRYFETRRQTMKEHKGADLDDKENFDIVLDTSNRSPEEVSSLLIKKITDFNQKMNPPKFYFAHPHASRKEMREWELEFEKRTGIELINPFFDCNTPETELGHLGIKKYDLLGERSAELFRGDLEGLTREDVIGGIFILDKKYTLGTPMEMMADWLIKLNYSVVMQKKYFNHSGIRHCSTEVFKNVEELETFLMTNKTKLFRLLEKKREKIANDPISKKIYKEMKRNMDYR